MPDPFGWNAYWEAMALVQHLGWWRHRIAHAGPWPDCTDESCIRTVALLRDRAWQIGERDERGSR